MNDTERFKKEYARQRRVDASRLTHAKRKAAAAGKEAFDLTRLARFYDVSPFLGDDAALIEREYYLVYPEVLTLAEFAARKRVLDPHMP